MDRRLYLDVNRFAARTAWAHVVVAFFARPAVLVVLVLLFAIALARSRVAGFGGTDLDEIARVLWVAFGTVLAYAVSVPVVHLVARARPFVAMPQAVVLLARPTGFSFPNEHAVVAGAVAGGLWMCRTKLIACAATLVAILVALAVVYTGTAYPSDAVGGLLIGIFISLVIYPLAIGLLRKLVHVVSRSPVKVLVVASHHRKPTGPGPAAHPELVGESGAVRILPPDEVRAVRILPAEEVRTIHILPPDETRTVRILRPEDSEGIRILPPDEVGDIGIMPPGETGTGPSTDRA